MKRFIALLLITIMTTVTVNVWADSLDLSGYDDTALVELLGQVQQEVADRHIEKTAELQAGDYIGGRDVPEGTYVWHCMASGDDWGTVTVYSLDENGGYFRSNGPVPLDPPNHDAAEKLEKILESVNRFSPDIDKIIDDELLPHGLSRDTIAILPSLSQKR